MTRHDTPVEPLAGLVPVATSFNLWLDWELKPISLNLLLLARYSTIFPGIIELPRCHTNLPVNTELDLKVKSLILQALAEPEHSQRLKTIQSLLDLIDYLPKSLTKERIVIGLQTYYKDLNISPDNVTRLWYKKCVPLLAEIAQKIRYEIDAKRLQQIEEE